MSKKSHPVCGHPPKYRTPEEMDRAITAYFNGGAYKNVPTITDLVLYLGFADRHSFYDYENRAAFSHTIKKARSLIEREYENLLRQPACTGAIFALKNFGWIDRREVEQKVQMDIQITHQDVEDRLSCFTSTN